MPSPPPARRGGAAGRWRRRGSLVRARSRFRRLRLGGQIRRGVGFGILAGIAEDVLRDTLALAARPVDRRPSLPLRDVPEPVDGHQLQVIWDLQQSLQPLPVLGDLHRRRDELDAHAELRRGEPDILDGGPHPEDGVEARELAGTVLGLVQEYRKDKRRARDELPVVLAQGPGDAEAVHHGLTRLREDLAPERLEDAGHLVEVDTVALLLHLGLSETEVGPVALPERPLLQKARHALAAYPRNLIYSLAVIDEHEAPGLAVEVGRCHRGDLDEQALVLGLHRVWQKGAVRGLAPLGDLQEIQSQPPKASMRIL